MKGFVNRELRRKYKSRNMEEEVMRRRTNTRKMIGGKKRKGSEGEEASGAWGK